MSKAICRELQRLNEAKLLITVGNTEITIELIGECENPEYKFNNRYFCDIVHRFGKGKFTNYFEVISNNIYDVVEYFREFYRGHAAYKTCEEKVKLIPFSWE